MKNLDLAREDMQKTMQALSDALQANDVDAATTAFEEMQNSVCERIEREFEQYRDVTDMSILQSRGLRMLTSEETAWYQKFIAAVKSGAKQEIVDLTNHMVPTIIDRVIEDMRTAHPLLAALNIQNAAGATRLVMNAKQMASLLGSWGEIGGAITTEVKGRVRYIDITAAKYTAYFLIPKDFVRFNFGFAPMWVDSYIRIILSETVANGLEKTIVQGDGDGQFIGLAFDTTTASNNKYSEKTALPLTSWDDYAGLIADNLLIDANGDYRNVTEVIAVVNPIDYVKKIGPTMRVITPAGVLNKIDHEFPTKVVTSAFVAAGTMKVGVAENYFAAINGGESGIIEYSDDAQFLADQRVYTTRLYGMGRPIDNTSFINVNISGLDRYVWPVAIKGTVKTKEQA